MTERIATIEGFEQALAKVLAPLGLELVATTWQRDLSKGTVKISIKVAGLTDEQLSLFGGGKS